MKFRGVFNGLHLSRGLYFQILPVEQSVSGLEIVRKVTFQRCFTKLEERRYYAAAQIVH